MRRWLPFLLACVAVACTPPAPAHARPPGIAEPAPEGPSDELTALLRADPTLDALLGDAERRRMQVLVAVPVEDANGTVRLRRLGFRVDDDYFYPASAVKLLGAVAALEKLEELRRQPGQAALGVATRLRVTDGVGAARRVVDTTLRDDIERSLVVSDNAAHNRLFGFVGKEELAERLARIGLGGARLVHGLGEAAPTTASYELIPPGAEPLPVAQRVGFELAPPSARNMLVGTAHVDDAGRVVPGPMDFTEKNAVPLRELSDLLIAIARPDLAETPPPDLAPEDREMLLSTLGRLPSELRGAPSTPDARAQLDDLHKPLLRAVTAELPGHRVRVLGKGGRAYGFYVESSYVVDDTTGRSMFVAATIHANDNGTLNDDRYEYTSVAEPFVAQLGRVLARAFLAAPAK